MSDYDQRLERIEGKIDQLADAMISMARAEEKITALQDDHEKMYERINKLSGKMDDLDRMARENARSVQVFQKAFWIVFAAAASSVAAHFYMLQ